MSAGNKREKYYFPATIGVILTSHKINGNIVRAHAELHSVKYSTILRCEYGHDNVSILASVQNYSLRKVIFYRRIYNILTIYPQSACEQARYADTPRR